MEIAYCRKLRDTAHDPFTLNSPSRSSVPFCSISRYIFFCVWAISLQYIPSRSVWYVSIVFSHSLVTPSHGPYYVYHNQHGEAELSVQPETKTRTTQFWWCLSNELGLAMLNRVIKISNVASIVSWSFSECRSASWSYSYKCPQN